MRRVFLRQDEVLEVDDAHGLRPQPAVRHKPDVVLRRHGLKDGDGEHDVLGVSRHHLRGDDTHTYVMTCERLNLHYVCDPISGL